MANPLTAADLDNAQCAGCREPVHPHKLFLHQRCHPSAGTWASYHAGVLTITCRKCEKLVANIEVAKGAASPTQDQLLVTAIEALTCDEQFSGHWRSGYEHAKRDVLTLLALAGHGPSSALM